MRRWMLAGMVAAVGLAAMPSTAGATTFAALTHVAVGPRSIGPQTNVLVRFVEPASTGTIGTRRVRQTLVVSGPQSGACIHTTGATLAGAQAGTTMRITLYPARLGGRWCIGTYAGRVQQSASVTCGIGPVMVCPQYVVVSQTIARFDFRVGAR